MIGVVSVCLRDEIALEQDTSTTRMAALITEHQSMLYAYIMTLVGNPVVASDVLQETNLVLWQKAEQFTEGTSFIAWARKAAYFQVLAYARDRKRSIFIFDDELLGEIAEESAKKLAAHDRQRSLLHRCLKRLSPRNRELIQRRYSPGGSVANLAREFGQSVGAISQALYRSRQALIDCTRSIAEQEENA
ncbi:MAG: sigma-70 family RNA polymerase sigma factor [Planctomycetes bacterium]|nr:sigma-70 family RNA polymerase sigma factor [Planctomycetota bacterium]